LSIGIVPRAPRGPFDEPHRDRDGRSYPNRFNELAIHTPLPPRTDNWRTTPARNHVNVLTADAVIALPGGVGTENELDMAAEYRSERTRLPAERRTILVGPLDEFTAEHRQLFVHGATPSDAERHLRRVLAANGLVAEARSAS
jgi:predicted Rossmann-fold nucleotide-binding protein